MDEITWRWENGDWKKLPQKPLSITLVTGFAAKDFISEICNEIKKRLPFLHLTVLPVENRFFGKSVTVAGLICGGDLIEAVKKTNPEILFIPAVSLRHERDLFLDNVAFEDLEKELGCPVYAVENGIPLLDQIETLLNGR